MKPTGINTAEDSDTVVTNEEDHDSSDPKIQAASVASEDGMVDVYPQSSDKVFEPNFPVRGPLWAIEQFLLESSDFEADPDCERYILTQNPHGFLKRIRVSKISDL